MCKLTVTEGWRATKNVQSNKSNKSYKSYETDNINVARGTRELLKAESYRECCYYVQELQNTAGDTVCKG